MEREGSEEDVGEKPCDERWGVWARRRAGIEAGGDDEAAELVAKGNVT